MSQEKPALGSKDEPDSGHQDEPDSGRRKSKFGTVNSRPKGWKHYVEGITNWLQLKWLNTVITNYLKIF
jgi:hypothetical protein